MRPRSIRRRPDRGDPPPGRPRPEPDEEEDELERAIRAEALAFGKVEPETL